jgi:hypothetical protein
MGTYKTNSSSLKGTNMMTETEALEFVADALRTILDDDYPHTQDALVDDLMTEGFTEEVAEELVYGPGGIGH